MAGRHHVRVEVCAPGLGAELLHRLQLLPDVAPSGVLDGTTFYIAGCGAWVSWWQPTRFRPLPRWGHCLACFPNLFFTHRCHIW